MTAAKGTVTDAFDPDTHPFWHGFAPMHFVLREAGPRDMWVRGEGPWLVDARGDRYLDARSGIGNMALGYGREDIASAIHRQALELPFVCTMRWERAVPVAVDYSRALVDAAPPGLTRVRFTHTGSAAVESALLMARNYHRNLGRRRKRILVSLEGSYHGSTMMAMAASGQRILHRFFGPMPEGFAYLPVPDPAATTVSIGDLDPDEVAAVIVEPVKGLSGVPLPSAYLQALREFCTRHDILLIFDEVFTGFGRTGTMFASELGNVVPDIVALSKALTGGTLPLAATVATAKIFDAFWSDDPKKALMHGPTYMANALGCAAANASLDLFETEPRLKQVAGIAAALAEGLAPCRGVRGVKDVRVQGAIGVVELDRIDNLDAMRARFIELGVFVRPIGNVIYLTPAFTISADELTVLISAVVKVVHEQKH
jgi:adenosylmethionine-8-amino-7-oxononanoate aminotransferase